MRLIAAALSIFTLNFGLADQDDVAALPLTHTFIPDTFSEDDNVQVILSGVLLNTCLQPKYVKVKKVERQFYLDVMSKSDGCFCLPFEQPFFKVVNLGKLPRGSYWVQSGELQNIREIQVQESSNEERPLAYITSAKMFMNELVIRGKFFDTSVYVESVDIKVQSDGTIVVYPLIGERKGLKNFVTRTFKENIDLTEYLEPNFNHLVHVKSSNNRTFNVMVGVFNDPKIGTKNEEAVRNEIEELVTKTE